MTLRLKRTKSTALSVASGGRTFLYLVDLPPPNPAPLIRNTFGGASSASADLLTVAFLGLGKTPWNRSTTKLSEVLIFLYASFQSAPELISISSFSGIGASISMASIIRFLGAGVLVE